ncbi:MAG: RNA polymerase sigma factor [Candidatus Marinimicrobia bacterium]|nr:RNA polymerase sigma factor [Candidatus Neomarinimicrobiota bacterium]
MKTDPRQFLLLFDDSFADLYRYVARRVSDEIVREQVVELVYMDAIGQMATCPNDVNFSTWLYSVARGRVAEYVKGSIVGAGVAIESPVFEGASIMDGVYDDEFKLKQQADTFFSTLTLEEREIVKLKFFEELTDGEVLYVLGLAEGTVGAKIYQVLRRGYEVLFGEVSEGGDVYYGELHSFLARLKGIEKIPFPETFKLKLRTEITNKLERMYSGSFQTGSKDPAKAFVYAAKGMSKEEVDQVTEEYVRERSPGAEPAPSAGAEPFERKVPVEEESSLEDFAGIEDVPVYHADERALDEDLRQFDFAEKILDVWDKWKAVMSVVPAVLFVSIIGVVVWVVFFRGGEDGGVTGLGYPVDYGRGFEAAVVEDPTSVADYEEKVYIEENLIVKIVDSNLEAGGEVSVVEADRDESKLEMVFEMEKLELSYVFEDRGEQGYRVKSVKKH